MRQTKIIALAGLIITAGLAGCAGTGDVGLQTSSVAPPRAAPPKPLVNPVCIGLAAKIREIRAEGTPAKVHAVANGKTKVVRVRRASLAKMAELDRLNTEFQLKCSKYPAIQTGAMSPASTPVVARGRTPATTAQARPASPTPIVMVPKQR